jgi:hypothetical protein
MSRLTNFANHIEPHYKLLALLRQQSTAFFETLKKINPLLLSQTVSVLSSNDTKQLLRKFMQQSRKQNYRTHIF